MSDQPEALFLADVIENDPTSAAHHAAAAAELRRLHAERDALKHRLQLHDACNGVMGERGYVPECISLRAERDALRARNKELVAMICEVHTTLMPNYSKSHEGRAWLEKMAKLT
ncbi:MAG: hypothetical protein ACK515_22535 [bacterium]